MEKLNFIADDLSFHFLVQQHHRQQWPQRTMHSQKDAKGVVSPAHPSLVSSPTSRRLEEPPNAAAELARLQKEERERRELYEKAQANFNAVVDEAKVEYLRAYRAARETIARCAEDVARAVTQCKEHQERLDEAKKEQATAHEELENVKKAYDLNTGVVWQAERTLYVNPHPLSLLVSSSPLLSPFYTTKIEKMLQNIIFTVAVSCAMNLLLYKR